MSKKTKKDYPKNWGEISEQIKDRDGWKCQECGLQFPKDKRLSKTAISPNGKRQSFGVHHKDRDPMNCDPGNLISLCSACHCRAEWPLIRAEMEKK